MMKEKIQSCCLAAFFVLGTQSLTDVAREEEERRRLIDQQGVEERVVSGDSGQWAPNANVTRSKVPLSGASKSSAPGAKSEDRSSINKYRSAIQRLDKAILQEESRLETKRERLASAKHAPIRIGRSSAGNQPGNNIMRLQSEIEDIEEKLKQLRQDRLEKYEEGRKAGYLPGELDGKGGY